MTRYWWSTKHALKHALWDWREALFVRLALHYLHNHATVYVHPTSGGRAVAVLHRLDCGCHDEPHTHVEGEA